jgi:hypothetical protein
MPPDSEPQQITPMNSTTTIPKIYLAIIVWIHFSEKNRRRERTRVVGDPPWATISH